MSRSPDDAAATWLDSPGSPIAGLVGRLVAALNDCASASNCCAS
jgi:hypothetical protein